MDNLIACHGDETTYEADAVYDNYDGQKYLENVTDWATDMPGSYLDTGISDGPDEPTYTVGTEAYNHRSGQRYFTNIRTNHGNARTDSGKANGQRATTIARTRVRRMKDASLQVIRKDSYQHGNTKSQDGLIGKNLADGSRL